MAVARAIADDNRVLAVLQQISDEILGQLRFLSRSVERRFEEGRAREEWVVMATVIDRLLFWLFVLSNAVLLTFLFAYRKGLTRGSDGDGDVHVIPGFDFGNDVIAGNNTLS